MSSRLRLLITTPPDTPLLDKPERPEAEVDVEEEETETSRTTRRVLKEDPLELPEAVVDVENPVNPELTMVNAETAREKVTSPRTAPSPRKNALPERNVKVVPVEEEVETVSPERMMVNAATARVKVTSLETAPSPRRSVPLERNVKVAEVEVETANPRKETTSAATATPKVTSPEIAPSPRRSALRDPDATSLPVPPLVRPAETATKKVTSLEIAPLLRRRELPVRIDPPESPGHATTAVKRDISPETALKLSPLLRERRRPKVLRESLKEKSSPLRVKTIRRVSTEKISPLGKPERPRKPKTLRSEPRPPSRLLLKLTPLLTSNVSLPASTTL